MVTSVTGMTAERMLAIENNSIVDGDIVGNDLVLTRRDGTVVNAGNVRGPQGPPGGSIDHITFENLPSSGIVTSHRLGGGSGAATAICSEGTMEGAWTSLALGANILDVDCRMTADGKIVLMHDLTVDRTTLGTGLVSNHVSTALPPIDPSEVAGRGWGDYLHVATLEEFLTVFGGKVVITLEAKDGVPMIPEMCRVIRAKGLQDSVMINTNSLDVIAATIAEGVRGHLWAWSDTSKITPGIEAGASLIEIPYNASAEIVAECQAAVADSGKALRWFLAGPISTRSQYNSMTPGIMGHVSDSLGHTNRASGNNPITTTITPSIMAGKRGIGWRTSFSGGDPTNLLDLQPGKGLAWKNIAGSWGGVYLGDMSGTMPGSYSLTMKFIAGAAFTGASQSLRFRFAGTIPDAVGTDTDANGYLPIINANGRFRLYSSAASLTDAPILLYEDATAAQLTPGAEYTLVCTITPTTVKASITGANINKTSPNIPNTDWRGGHIYLWRLTITGTSPDTFITDFSRS